MSIRNHKGKRILLLSTAVMLPVVGVLAGCTGGAPEAPKDKGVVSTPNANGPKPPVAITMMVPNFGTDLVTNDTEYMKAFMAATNSKLDVNYVPGDYDAKVSATMASGNLPMAMVIKNSQIKSTMIINAVRSGVFWEVGKYIKDYPNMSKYMNNQVLQNYSVDGKVYGLYRARDLASEGMIFRKDWADQIGLGTPKTLDDLYKLLKHFAHGDPDKNGKNDTLGYSEFDTMRGFRYIATVHGAPNEWEWKDGKITPDFFTEEYLNTLKFYKRLYDEKIMNEDFAVAKRPQQTDNMNKGRAGAFFADLDQGPRFTAEVAKVQQGATIDVISRIEGPKGVRIPGTIGFNGVFLFPKSSVKTEADLKRILEYFDTLFDPKVENLIQWGIEGRHYSLQNGKPVRTQEQGELYTKEVVPYQQGLGISDLDRAIKGDEAPLILKYKAMVKENASLALANPARPLVSPTHMEKGGELDKMIADNRIKFIMGVIDEKGWKAAIESWRKAGGDKVIDEYTAEYKKANP